jgi:hypothetical protein
MKEQLVFERLMPMRSRQSVADQTLFVLMLKGESGADQKRSLPVATLYFSTHRAQHLDFPSCKKTFFSHPQSNRGLKPFS